MRKILIILVISLFTTLFASEINWKKDYNVGMKEAMKYNKPMLFVISNKNCPPCRRLANTTFEDAKVVKELNREFVSVIAYVNFTNPASNDYVPRELFTGVTPTIWFMIPSDDVVFSPVKGAPDAASFLDMMSQVKEQAKASRKEKK